MMESLVPFFGVLLAYPAIVHSAPVDERICTPGFYTFKGNGPNCQVCPPGTYSDIQGAEFCKSCLDTFYSDDGANSAELWNGDLYCVHLGLADDDFFNSNSGDTIAPTISGSPSSIPVTFGFSYTVPPEMQSTGPSEVPSSVTSTQSESHVQSRSPTPSLTINFRIGDSKLAAVCNDNKRETNHFEWHGRCRECPTKKKIFFVPIIVLLIFALINLLLESLIPVCFNTQFWWAAEYLQMLYLIGISSDSWSPVTAFLFEKVVPIFAMDFNMSFSLQCIMDSNWPLQEATDQLFILSLPIIFAMTLNFLLKVFGNRVFRDASVPRWMATLLYLCYLKLILSSLEALQLPVSWSADELSNWVNSHRFYNTLGGIAGLMVYGLAYPFWLLQSILRYHYFSDTLVDTDIEIDSSIEQEDNGDCERQYNDPRTKKRAKKKNELFMTIGVFPINPERNRSWQLGTWMLRKFLFAVLWFNFPDEQGFFLVIFLLIYLLSIIVDKYYLSLDDELCETSACTTTKKWYSIATMDVFLQVCLVAVISLAFLSFLSVNGNGSRRSFFHKRVADILLVLVFSASLVYIIAVIGVCCSQPDSRFYSVLSENTVVISSNNDKKYNRNKHDNATTTDDDDKPSSAKENSITAARADETSSIQNNSVEQYFSYNTRKEADTIDADKDRCKEYYADLEPQTVDCDTPKSLLYLVGDDSNHEISRRKHCDEMINITSTRRQTELFRGDSLITSNNDNDAETFYEEIWIDEETGKEISDPTQGKWMDTSTGHVVISPKNCSYAE